MSVLVLTRRDVAALMRPADYRTAVEAAFRAEKGARAFAPPPMHIDGAGGVFHAKGASLDDGGKFVALKFNGNFPGNRAKGLPTIQGAILLCDAENGSLLAILDSIEITLWRTAAASALAASHLARKDAETLLICGCGEQGRAHVLALAEVRAFSRAYAYDIDAVRAQTFATEMRRLTGIRFDAGDFREAAQRSDVIALCTTAAKPYLEVVHVRSGAFIAAVGADNPHKNEVAPELMAASRVVVDVAGQCAAMGDLRAAISAGTMTIGDVYADLGDILTGRKEGRTGDGEIFIFDSTGTALQDVASAATVYERALERGAGLKIAFGGA